MMRSPLDDEVSASADDVAEQRQPAEQRSGRVRLPLAFDGTQHFPKQTVIRLRAECHALFLFDGGNGWGRTTLLLLFLSLGAGGRKGRKGSNLAVAVNAPHLPAHFGLV